MKELCSHYGIEPARTNGQNFLISERIADRIVDAAGDLADLHVLEIGPGLGILTERIVRKAKSVTAVELDRRTVEAFIATVQSKKLECVRADILRWWKETGRTIIPTPYAIISNLPYAITSRVLREFLTTSPKPVRMVLTVQREVAERVTAGPGDMSLLALSVQAYADAKKLFLIDRDAFWPRPDITSAVICLDAIRTEIPEADELFRVARAAFAGKRKQLKNSLANSFHCPTEAIADWLESLGVDPRCRPQELGVDLWMTIAQHPFPREGETKTAHRRDE